MCGRYTLFAGRSTLESQFGATFEGYEPTYNAAPGQQLPVICDDDPDRAVDCSWGLVPAWVDDPDDATRPINARSETVTERSTFRAAYRQRRCLVPADGFYEWVREDGRKRPYRVRLADDRPFAMAGLYEVWEGVDEQTSLARFGTGRGDDGAGGEDGEDRTRRIESFAVLTTEPNEVVADLHDRMAVVLAPGEYDRWLTAEDPRDLLDPYPAGEMEAYPVSRRVNDPGNDAPDLVDPV